MTGGVGFTVLVFFFLSVFAVADVFAGKRLATGFLAIGLGIGIAEETALESLASALKDFTALDGNGLGAIVVAVGGANSGEDGNGSREFSCGSSLGASSG